ncbi:MAG: tetratricopeptide repeat protein [bacterium]|nr:tetratricopeptide repeat protein [bacterium]
MKGKSVFYNIITREYFSLDFFKRNANTILKTFIFNEISGIKINLGDFNSLEKAHEGFYKRLKVKKVTELYIESLLKKAMIQYYLGEYNLLRRTAEESLKLAKKIKYREGREHSYYLIGLSYYGQAKYKKAIEYSTKSSESKLFEIAQDSLSLISTIYYYLNDYDKASYYFDKLRRLREKKKNPSLLAGTYSFLASLNFSKGEYRTALKNINKSVKLYLKTGELLNASFSMTNLGVILDTLGMIEEAKQTYLKAISIKEKAGDIRGLGYCYHNMGILEKNGLKIKEAILYFEKAISIRKSIGDSTGLNYSLNGLVSCYIYLKNPTKTIKLLKKVVEFAKKKGDNVLLSYAYLNYGNLYIERKDKRGIKRILKILKEFQSRNNNHSVLDALNKFKKKLKEVNLFPEGESV